MGRFMAISHLNSIYSIDFYSYYSYIMRYLTSNRRR